MASGPVQWLAIALQSRWRQGDIERVLRAASDVGIITILDALAVRKRDDGTLASLGAIDLTPHERQLYGSVIGALIGLNATGTAAGAQRGSDLGADAVTTRMVGWAGDTIRGVADHLVPGMIAVLVLFEHRWAACVKDAVVRAGGSVLAHGMVRPAASITFGEEINVHPGA